MITINWAKDIEFLRIPKGKGFELDLKPFHFGYESKEKNIAFNMFNRRRIYESKYKAFEIYTNYFKHAKTKYGYLVKYSNWFELIILNVIMSLRIDRQRRTR